jgi:hypothetical protein
VVRNPETGAKEREFRMLEKVIENEVPPGIEEDILTTLKVLEAAVYPQATPAVFPPVVMEQVELACGRRELGKTTLMIALASRVATCTSVIV